MLLYLARHGSTEYNEQGISMGQGIDAPLSSQGIDQAIKLAAKLEGTRFDAIYSSDLQRALQTAEIVRRVHVDSKFIVDKRIRERSLGIYEGRPKELWQQAASQANDSFDTFRPTDGESYNDVLKRSLELQAELSEKIYNNVLIVSHAGVITSWLSFLLKQPLTRETYNALKPHNTAVSIFELNNKTTISRCIQLNS